MEMPFFTLGAQFFLFILVSLPLQVKAADGAMVMVVGSDSPLPSIVHGPGTRSVDAATDLVNYLCRVSGRKIVVALESSGTGVVIHVGRDNFVEKYAPEISKLFAQECLYVPTERIQVIAGGQGNRKVYQTVEEAMENKLGFVPSPVDLAQDVRRGEVLKPVRVIRHQGKTDEYDYDIIEGRIRYWAWVIAHNGKKPIPVFIRDN